MTMWIDLKTHFAARSLEWWNALILTAWGAYIILHPGLFTGPLHQLWAGHLAIAPQETWGLAAFAIGFTRVVALFINGQWSITPIIRVATSFLSVFIWFWVAIGLFRSEIPSVGYITYGGLMLADMYSAFRAAGDAYEAEAMKRLKELAEAPENVRSLRAR